MKLHHVLPLLAATAAAPRRADQRAGETFAKRRMRHRRPMIATRIATLGLLALMALGCEEPAMGPTLQWPIWMDDTGPAQTWVRGTAITVFTVPAVDAGHPAPTYSARGLPPGLQFKPSTRLISGTPNTVGSGTIIISATNRYGTNTWSMAWTVIGPPPAPSAPRWTDDTGEVQSWPLGTAIPTFTVPAADVGHPTPTYSASGLPMGLQFDSTTRQITGTPDTLGTGTITVTATNASGSATWTMAWTITDPDLGLKADRDILLAAQYVLHDDGLGWDAAIPIEEWPHVGIGLHGSGRPRRVTSLGLGFMDLNGQAPASLGDLSELYSLSLRYNGLTGEIPGSWGRLTKLHFLDIDGSGLEGCLPSALRSRLNQGGSDIDWYPFCDDVLLPLPEPRSDFDIDIHYLGLNSAAIGRSSVNGRASGRVSVVQAEVDRAVKWWESKITGDIPDEALSRSFYCGNVGWIVNGQTVDDIAVIVEIGKDAPQNGGRAFVCQPRGAGGTYPPEGYALPLLARIVIHEDWIRSRGESYAWDGPGRIEKLVRHELGHALGFDRVVFRALNLTEVAGGQWRFTGTTARAQFARTNLPWDVDDVKRYGVPLTSDESHLPFHRQIMSPRAPWEESLLTLAMMKDLGYPRVVLP